MAAPSGPVTPAQVDFDAVFKTAGMDLADLDRVRKAEELLKGLPEATPVEVKRQIVEASLKAFGFDVAKIIGAAQNQLKALDTYVRLNEQQTAKGITDAQAQIAQLEDKVISLRADINKRTDQLASIAAAAEGRKGQVHSVLQFFTAPGAPAAKP
jgi:cell division protein FtsB